MQGNKPQIIKMMKQKIANPANNPYGMPVKQQGMNKGTFSGMANMESDGSTSIGQPPLIPPSNFPGTQSMVTQGLQQKQIAVSNTTTTNTPFPTAPVTLANQNGPATSVGGSTVPGPMIVSSSTDLQQPQQIQILQPQTHQMNGCLELEQTQETMMTLQQQQNLANTKEKTPMCLINELARYNKINHQYMLVDEQGPAHKKTFYVKLQLGENEDYSASGPSIKKAQHAAAKMALEKTSYKHPPPKQNRYGMRVYQNGIPLNNITPTVELNAIAMKRGEEAIYTNLDNRLPPFPQQQQQHYDYRGYYNQRYPYMRMPKMFYTSLKVGNREFLGEGTTRQLARHSAATKALRILKSLPMPNIDNEEKLPVAEHQEEQKEEEHGDDSKSEISLVHELALRHNLPVTFDVIRESGPPHMKTFVTLCVVGEFSTEAEGNSKKVSKKRAAQLMLKELEKLPPLPVTLLRVKSKHPASKKKNRNLIKIQKADPNYGVGINPISRLIQIQQAQKRKEPEYTLIAERGLPRRREFVIQVTVDDKTCTGTGPNKKLAKRHAAEAMLDLLGYNKPTPQPAKPAIRSGSPSETSNTEKKVTFVDPTEESKPATGNGQPGRQIMPGLLILPDGNIGSSSYSQLQAIAAQYQQGGKPRHAFGIANAEQQLKEFATKYKFELKIDEFSGQSNSEYLSRVSMLTNPPVVMHGSGPTPDVAREAASFNALKALSEKGIIILSDEKVTAAGDATQLKKEKDQLANSAKRIN
ncbi:hypothetical protein CHS0354_020689 [Potamilus streckersoni]|uniref:DRBM domain-containing protein n=1 Tax=Potamilus streckersoni TaxID=2493646 RepID=A0AAE0TF02_9BIVA|nr:hypothetical protein CHS0354_020689 [Potamilus streckersoni]